MVVKIIFIFQPSRIYLPTHCWLLIWWPSLLVYCKLSSCVNSSSSSSSFGGGMPGTGQHRTPIVDLVTFSTIRWASCGLLTQVLSDENVWAKKGVIRYKNDNERGAQIEYESVKKLEEESSYRIRRGTRLRPFHHHHWRIRLYILCATFWITGSDFGL